MKDDDGTNKHFNTVNYSNNLRNQNGVSSDANCFNPIKLPKMDEASNILINRPNNSC